MLGKVTYYSLIVLTPAVLLAEIGEAPNGAETHSVADHCQQVLPLRIPRFPVLDPSVPGLGGHAGLDGVSGRRLIEGVQLFLGTGGALYGLGRRDEGLLRARDKDLSVTWRDVVTGRADMS